MHTTDFLTGPSLTAPVGPYTDRTFTAGGPGHRRRNDYRNGLINGQRGVVTAVDPDLGTLTVRLAGRVLSLDAGCLREGGLDHGSALTMHPPQGMTCGQAMLLGSDALSGKLATSDCPAAASATGCTWPNGPSPTTRRGRTVTALYVLSPGGEDVSGSCGRVRGAQAAVRTG